MLKLVKERKDCSKCGHMIEAEKQDMFCDNCQIKVDWDNKNGYPFTFDFVGRFDNPEGEKEDAHFCSIECGLKWIKNDQWKKYDTKNHFFSAYFHQHELEVLSSFLTGESK